MRQAVAFQGNRRANDSLLRLGAHCLKDGSLLHWDDPEKSTLYLEKLIGKVSARNDAALDFFPEESGGWQGVIRSPCQPRLQLRQFAGLELAVRQLALAEFHQLIPRPRCRLGLRERHADALLVCVAIGQSIAGCPVSAVDARYAGTVGRDP